MKDRELNRVLKNCLVTEVRKEGRKSIKTTHWSNECASILDEETKRDVVCALLRKRFPIPHVFLKGLDEELLSTLRACAYSTAFHKVGDKFVFGVPLEEDDKTIINICTDEILIHATGISPKLYTPGIERYLEPHSLLRAPVQEKSSSPSLSM